MMAGQLQAAVSSIVERNMMIDALSLKQSELTARLAMQVGLGPEVQKGRRGEGYSSRVTAVTAATAVRWGRKTMLGAQPMCCAGAADVGRTW